MEMNSHVAQEYRLMVFKGPTHAHVYICIAIYLFTGTHHFPRLHLLQLAISSATTPSSSLHSLFSVCAVNLDYCRQRYFSVHAIVPCDDKSNDAILFISEATLIA